jgi:hypothetical protein
VVSAQSHLNSFSDQREVVTEGNDIDALDIDTEERNSRRQSFSCQFEKMYWNEMLSPNDMSTSNLFDLLESRNDDMNSEYSFTSLSSEAKSSLISMQSNDDKEEEEEEEASICNSDFILDNECSSEDTCTEIEKPPEESSLLKHECRSNEIKKRQDLLVFFFYDNFPAKLNRIGGREANVELAMMCLDYVLKTNLTDAEGDKLLELVREVVFNCNQDSICPVPMRTKTLRRAFLVKADRFFPLKYEKIALLHEYFGSAGMEVDGKKKKIRIPPTKKAYRMLEDALAMLLLKMNAS